MKFCGLLIGAIVVVVYGQENFENVTDFDTIDTSKDGQISLAEFQKWLEGSGRNFGDALQIFQNYDTDSNGRLGISEFVPLAYKLNQRSGTEDDTIFKRFDLNKDGILTRKEIENSDKTLGPEIIEGLFLVADTNVDGKITYEEFKQISATFGQTTDKHSKNIGAARSLLDSMDANNDRRLSQQEVYNFVNQFNKVNEQTIAVAFYQLDVDRDNYISLEELQALPQKITDLAGFQQMPTV